MYKIENDTVYIMAIFDSRHSTVCYTLNMVAYNWHAEKKSFINKKSR